MQRWSKRQRLHDQDRVAVHYQEKQGDPCRIQSRVYYLKENVKAHITQDQLCSTKGR